MPYITKLCCICGTEICQKKLLSTSNNSKLIEKLIYCVPEVANFSSDYITSFCESCVKKMDCVYHFKKSCIKTHKILNNYAKQLNIKNRNDVSGLEINVGVQIKDEPIAEMNDGFINQYRITDVTEPDDKEAVHTLPQQLESHSADDSFQSRPEQETFYLPSSNYESTSLSSITQELQEYLQAHTLLSRNLLQMQARQNSANTSYADETVKSKLSDTEFLGFNKNEIEKSKLYSQNQLTLIHSIKLKQKSGPKKYHCAICNKGYTRSENFKVHVLLHEEDTPFLCNICNKSFKYQASLRDHINLHLNVHAYKCKLCNLTFNTHGQMYYHRTVTHKQAMHSCHICNRKFTFKSTLRRHTLTHSTLKFQCSFCIKTFGNQHNLLRHEATHSKVKPYPCNICKKTFATKSYLSIHLISHDKPKFGCSKCGKYFKRKENLKTHLEFHARIKFEHFCHFCPEVFQNKTQLKFHRRKKHHNQRIRRKKDV